ncbi:unnamed protein product [Absidia cylindrospora]
MPLSETATMATDTFSTGNHIQEPMEEQLDDFIGQQVQPDEAPQQDKLRQRALALVKPDAVQTNHQQDIIDKIILAGFTIIQQKQVQFTLAQACLFYREHENKPFYGQLTEWMSSAPIYAMVLEKENAVQDWRSLMGPTNAIKAREIDPTSIRALFGTDGSHNAAHGSDCLTSAEREIDIVFGNAQVASSSTDGTVAQSDLSTAVTSAPLLNDHDGSLLDDYNSKKDQPLATTKEIDSSGDDINDIVATTSDNTELFVPPAATTPLDTNNDVEHPVITSDSLSHPASPDRDDAPTCPNSDFVELASGDNQGATVNMAIPTEEKHDAAMSSDTDVQQTIFQVNTNNENVAPVNSDTKEALNEHDSLVVEASLSDQQQQVTNPVTENAVAGEVVADLSTLVETSHHQSTPDNTHNKQQVDDKDEATSLISAELDSSHTVEKDDVQETNEDKCTPAPIAADESTIKVSETTIITTTTTTTTTADDNITETVDHETDTIVDNSSTSADIIDKPTVEKEQQTSQALKIVDEDDDYDNTPEQETESLSIQEAISATTTTTTTDTIDAQKEDAVLARNHQFINTTSTTATTTATDDTPVESVAATIAHETNNIVDDKQQLTEAQDTLDKADDERRDDGVISDVGENFDTIPLAADDEEASTTGELAEKIATAVTESTPTAIVPEPTSSENTTTPVALNVEQGSTTTDELESTKESNIADELEPAVESIAVDAVADEPEPTEESIPDDVAISQPQPTEEIDPANVVADEPEPAVESIAVDAVADEPKPTEESIPDDVAISRPQPIDEINPANVVANELESTGGSLEAIGESHEATVVADQSESIKKYAADANVDELLEHIPVSSAVDEQVGNSDAPQSQNTVETEKEIETNDVEPAATENKTEDKDQIDIALATTAIEDEPKAAPNDDHQTVSNDDEAKEIETATVDQVNSVSRHSEDSAATDSKGIKSDEEPVKETKVASTSPARSLLRKPPTGTAKTPVKSTSPPAAARKSPTSATGATKPATATRLRRPGTTLASGTGSTGTATATSTTGTATKKALPKTSTSPGRSPLPRVATLAKKPAAKATDEPKTAAETKPTTTKKRSSVISRLTAPTAASSNKRTSETASSTSAGTVKATPGNGTATTHRTRVTSTTGHHAPTTTTRRPASKVSPASASDKPAAAKRISPSNTAATTRRISPPSSTTVHSKTARSTIAAPASSSRLSSTTTKSPPTDSTVAKRTPARRISPPTSTQLKSATKPTTKNNKAATVEKKGDGIRKKVKPSGTTVTATKKVTEDANDKSDNKEDEGARTENIHEDDGVVEYEENVKTDEDIVCPVTASVDVEEEQHEQNLENGHDHQNNIPEQPSVVQTVIEEQEGTTTTTTTTTTTDVEVDGTSLNPTTTDSSTKRPKTPEMAQLRNKFENMQAPTTVTPTRSSNKQPSAAPHNIKDLISRFN